MQAINAMVNLLLMCAEQVYIDDGEDIVNELMFSLDTEMGDYNIGEVWLLDLFGLNFSFCSHGAVVQSATNIFRNLNLFIRL